LPYKRPGLDDELTIAPEDYGELEGDILGVSKNWRIIATMNVFDKNLLFEMSYALMRRFAFIEVPSPPDEDFKALLEDWSAGDNLSLEVAKSLYRLRKVRDLGPALFRDAIEFSRKRADEAPIEKPDLILECFYSFFLPQFEGADEPEGKELYKTIAAEVGQVQRAELRRVLRAVLGVSDFRVAPVAEPEAESTSIADDVDAE